MEPSGYEIALCHSLGIAIVENLTKYIVREVNHRNRIPIDMNKKSSGNANISEGLLEDVQYLLSDTFNLNNLISLTYLMTRCEV